MGPDNRKRWAAAALGTLAAAAALGGLSRVVTSNEVLKRADAAQQQTYTSCDHPFVPTVPGSWRRFELRGPGDSAAVMEFRLLKLRPHQNELVATWEVEVESDLLPALRMESRPRCEPGAGAEAPWFGYMPSEFPFTIRGDRWRWPLKLELGTTFGGTIELVLAGRSQKFRQDVRVTVTRNHRVESKEVVEVPAGSFDAWRVVFSEFSAYKDTKVELQGALWVARDVGLVKAVLKQDERTQERVLVAFGVDAE